jgi:hypothetical protein
MRFRAPRLAARLLADVHFAFGGALIGGVAGFALAALPLLVAPRTAAAPPLVAHYRRLATGVGVGWVGGLLWCALLARNAHRRAPLPTAAALMRATWLAAGTAVVAEAAALFAGLAEGWAVALALAAATLAARARVAVASRETS